jgi:hypothetical protein
MMFKTKEAGASMTTTVSQMRTITMSTTRTVERDSTNSKIISIVITSRAKNCTKNRPKKSLKGGI